LRDQGDPAASRVEKGSRFAAKRSAAVFRVRRKTDAGNIAFADEREVAGAFRIVVVKKRNGPQRRYGAVVLNDETDGSSRNEVVVNAS
jgi:hypothetical protein